MIHVRESFVRGELTGKLPTVPTDREHPHHSTQSSSISNRATIAQNMDLKNLINHFVYRIEPKPGGGFIAHATDPSVPPLEAPTRAELQQKIQARISEALAQQFPGLKLQGGNQQLKMAFHIERGADGGFTIHSSDPNTQPTAAASHEIESQFAEKLIGFVGKHVLSPELAAQLNSGDIKVFVNRNGSGGTRMFTTTGTQAFSPTDLMRSLESTAQSGTASNAISPASGTVSYSDSPIKPETSSSWNLLRFLLALLVIGAIAYFFLRYR